MNKAEQEKISPKLEQERKELGKELYQEISGLLKNNHSKNIETYKGISTQNGMTKFFKFSIGNGTRENQVKLFLGKGYRKDNKNHIFEKESFVLDDKGEGRVVYRHLAEIDKISPLDIKKVRKCRSIFDIFKNILESERIIK